MKKIVNFAVIKQRTKRIASAPTLKTIAGLAGGNSLAMVIGVIGSLIQARFVTAADLGYFRSFAIITGYVFFLQLGFFDLLSRFYPYYMGKGQTERALSIAEIAQAWILSVTIIVNIVYIAFALFNLATGNWRGFLAWLVQIISALSFFYGGYLAATYRSGRDFGVLARVSVFASIANLSTLPVFLLQPYVALTLRSCVGNVVNISLLHIKRPLRVAWRFTWREWRELVVVSLPMFAAGYGTSLGWIVIETTIVLHFLGTQALGLWTMSFLVLDASNNLAQAIVAVYHPRIIEVFGRTESARSSLAICRKPLLLSVPSMLLLAIIGIALLPLVIPVLMPNYVAAIPTMALMLLMLPLIVLELPYALLAAMGKIAAQNVATYIGLASFAVLALISINIGFGLTGVVACSLIGRAIRIAFIYYILISIARKSN